jgi:hypothetical protein
VEHKADLTGGRVFDHKLLFFKEFLYQTVRFKINGLSDSELTEKSIGMPGKASSPAQND